MAWPVILVAYVTWASVSWVIPALSTSAMLGLTPYVTILTPIVLFAIPMVGLSRDAIKGLPSCPSVHTPA